ncbi:MAG: hypothetical protein DI537_48395, partial [Stutzerimonas stutzeri]
MLLPTAKRVAQANGELIRGRAATASMIALLFDQAGIGQARKEWEAAQATMDKVLDESRQLTEGTEYAGQLQQVAAQLADYRKAVKPLIDKLQQDAYADASSALADAKSAEAPYAAAAAGLGQLENLLNERAGGVFERVDTLVSRGLSGLWLTLAVCLVVGGLLAVRISRSIIGPLMAAKRYAERMAEGDLSRAPEVRGEDESAEMMQALAAM